MKFTKIQLFSAYALQQASEASEKLLCVPMACEKGSNIC